MNFDKIISEAKEVDIFAELTDEEKLSRILIRNLLNNCAEKGN